MAGAAAGSTTLSTELIFLLGREGVVEDFRAKLLEYSVLTVPKFAALVDAQEELKDLLKAEFDMDAKGGTMAVKAKVAAIVVGWTSAKARAAKQAEMDGEADARSEPKRIPASDTLAMKAMFEKRFWALEDELTPSKSYVERKLEMIEKDDLRAELLSEVLCVRDDGEETLRAVVDVNMNMKAIKIGNRSPCLRMRSSFAAGSWLWGRRGSSWPPTRQDVT